MLGQASNCCLLFFQLLLLELKVERGLLLNLLGQGTLENFSLGLLWS